MFEIQGDQGKVNEYKDVSMFKQIDTNDDDGKKMSLEKREMFKRRH